MATKKDKAAQGKGTGSLGTVLGTLEKSVNLNQGKGSKGAVSIEAPGDRGLRLRWRYGSQRFVLSLGLPDTRVNRAAAQQKATQIELDIASGNFDPSLKKYRSERELRQEQSSLIKLLETRIQATYNPTDASLITHLKAWGRTVNSTTDAENFVGWLRFVRKFKPSTIQRCLNTLKTIDREHFGHITIKGEAKGLPLIYSPGQIQRMLNFLKDDEDYSHYHDLVVCQPRNDGFQNPLSRSSQGILRLNPR